MIQYITGAATAFIVSCMGFVSLFLGILNLRETKNSKNSKQMLWIFIFAAIWNFGYAWMSLCYDNDFAYVPRAIALLSITFYFFSILIYIGDVANYSKGKIVVFNIIFGLSSLAAWYFVIQKSAVTFTLTYWGYWYYSKLSPARYLQFGAIIMGIVMYYIVLQHGISRAENKRRRHVLVQFMWFGPAIMLGYLLDTLIPSLFKTPALPGSCIGAFASTLILYRVSKTNRVFGISKTNVSEYIFDDVMVPIFITDREGKIMLMNEMTLTYLEKDRDEIMYHVKEDFLAKVGGSEGESFFDVIGTEKQCSVLGTKVDDHFGDLLYTIFFLHDATEERKAFRLMEESRKLAEESNAAKNDFLANMSHEIRTPLNAIIGMSQIIQSDEKCLAETRECAGEIYNAGNILLDIINDVLDISKVETGKFELENIKYSLPQILQDVMEANKPLIVKKHVKFSAMVDETIPRYLIGDAKRIRQVFYNILNNAYKFTKEGYVKVRITWNKDESHPELSISVKDTGCGIKPENMKKIFEKFNQIDSLRNRRAQGTGMGLAMSQGLVQVMGGEILVDSAFGGGSTFHIHIPQMVEKYEPIGAEIKEKLEAVSYKEAMPVVIAETKKRGSKKILLVDDTRINLEVAKGLLKVYEMQVDTAESGKEAIRMVKDQMYDLILMDYMMPEMDGVETMRKIRELGEDYESIPIIAVTADASEGIREKLIGEGMQDFISKPINSEVVDAMLEKWIPA